MQRLEDKRSRARRAQAQAAAWIEVNRDRLGQGRDLAQLLTMVAPPPMRLGLLAATLALEGAVTYADARRGEVSPGAARSKGVRLALEGMAAAATARMAPAVLARQAGRIIVARRLFDEWERQRRRAA
ncbi:MAG: hypothetical protein AAFQ88_04525 [Pseudomonadota bacterium]